MRLVARLFAIDEAIAGNIPIIAPIAASIRLILFTPLIKSLVVAMLVTAMYRDFRRHQACPELMNPRFETRPQAPTEIFRKDYLAPRLGGEREEFLVFCGSGAPIDPSGFPRRGFLSLYQVWSLEVD